MNLSVISAFVKKDILALLPLILLAMVVNFVQPLIAGMDLDGAAPFWVTLQGNIYWLGYGLGLLLLISVLQLDPANSLNHDWLTRPVPRADWLAAKLLFLLLTVYLPTVLARFTLNLGYDYGLARTLGYALAIEVPAALLPVPMVFAIALLTPNLRKFLFVSVLVFMVFLGPAWDLSRPLFELLGIDLGTDYDGLMWLQALPVALWGVAATLLIFWLRYSRRRIVQAWLTLTAGVGLTFFTLFSPPALYGWEGALAIHRALLNRAGDSLDAAFVLDFQQACFAAAPVNNLAAEPALSDARLYDDRLTAAGPGAVLFATTVSHRESLASWFPVSRLEREIPVHWALDRIRVQGRFSADSVVGEVQLIPADGPTVNIDPVAATATHYWLIPGSAVAALASDPGTRLTLDFDLGVLEPTVYEIPTDGRRHELPQLGSCRAELDSNATAIDVDCVKVGPQPSLVAAQLIGIDATRAYSLYRPTYQAGWLESISRKHYQLRIEAARLTDSSSVQLTAFNARRIIHKRLEAEGLLGDTADHCPLPWQQPGDAIERSSWSDTSSHEISSVAVEQGVRVEVLDWRRVIHSQAPTLLLLHGLGATAHSFDQLAPLLAQKYNVVAITRRGVGDSSKPDHGYDIARLSQDVLQVIETLQLERPVLIGHSIAGEELSYLGAHHGDRLGGLIYLDAGYDRTGNIDRRYRELSLSLPPTPPVRPSETTSYQAFLDYSRHRLGRDSAIPEGEILASYDLASGTFQHNIRYLDAVTMGLQAPDYSSISIPALGIYALPASPDALMEPWYDRDDPILRRTVTELFELERRGKEEQMARFQTEIPRARVLALENASHWVFVSHEQEVLAAIDSFLLETAR